MTILLLILLLLIFYYIKKSTNYWKLRNVNGPNPIPIFGNINESVLRRKNLAVIYQDIYRKFPQEKVVGIYTMTSPALIIRDLDIVKQILVKDFNCFSDRGFLMSSEKLGTSLFHCDRNTWAELKGKITPYFSSSKLKSIFNVILERGDAFVEHLEALSYNDPEQEVHKLFRQFGIDATLASIFNLNVDVYNDDNTDFFEKLDKSTFTKFYQSDLSMMLPGIMKTMNTSIFGDTILKFSNYIVHINKNGDSDAENVVQKLLNLKKVPGSPIKHGEEENDDPTTGNNANNKLDITDDIIASQVCLLFAAGYENTNLALSYAFYYLAKNIDVQNKLIEEIDTVLTQNNGAATYEIVNSMTYIAKVFNETLRLHPLANTIQRVATQDYIIPDTNVRIDKGVIVLISPFAIHRDEKYFADPLKYDPERFNSENRKRHSSAFIPFGLGPRSCFGKSILFVYSKITKIVLS